MPHFDPFPYPGEIDSYRHIIVGGPELLIIHLFLDHLAPLVTHCQDGRQDGETSHIGVLVVQPELVQGYECS